MRLGQPFWQMGAALTFAVDRYDRYGASSRSSRVGQGRQSTQLSRSRRILRTAGMGQLPA